MPGLILRRADCGTGRGADFAMGKTTFFTANSHGSGRFRRFRAEFPHHAASRETLLLQVRQVFLHLLQVETFGRGFLSGQIVCTQNSVSFIAVRLPEGPRHNL